MTIKKLKSIDIINVLSDLVSEKLETTVKLPHITKLRNHYHNKRDAIVKMLEESSLKDMITISKEDAGLHFLITIHTHMSDETLINKLKEEGIHLRAISHYYLKNIPHTSHTFIMNYSSIDLDKLPQAIEILEKILY